MVVTYVIISLDSNVPFSGKGANLEAGLRERTWLPSSFCYTPGHTYCLEVITTTRTSPTIGGKIRRPPRDVMPLPHWDVSATFLGLVQDRSPST